MDALHAPVRLRAPAPDATGTKIPMPMPDAPLAQPRAFAAGVQPPRAGAGGRSRAVPLLERLRFLCILGSNLDEFFEIRVAGIKEQLRAKIAPAGMTLQEARGMLGEIGDEARALIAAQYTLLNGKCSRRSRRAGVRLVRRTEFKPAQRAWAARYFEREVRPLLTPIGLDPAHPFPQVVNKSLNFVIELSGRDAFGARFGDRDREGAARAATGHPHSARRAAAATTTS